MDNKVKEALGSASYLTYHWRQYSFEQLEKEMVRVCGLCHKALGIPQDDSVTDFERGQWSVIQNVIGYIKDYSSAAELCREAGIGYKKIKALQKDCGYSYKEEVNDFLKESRNCGTDLKTEEQLWKLMKKIDEIIQQAKEEGAYTEDFDAFEQEIYDQGFRNAISFMLWNPSERSCSNCQYKNSRELCGEDYCGTKYWSPKLEE